MSSFIAYVGCVGLHVKIYSFLANHIPQLYFDYQELER